MAIPSPRPRLARTGDRRLDVPDTPMRATCGRSMSGGDAMTTQATADLVAEVQALIREREREGVVGLAELIGPAEWADLVPQREPSEVAVLIQWLPDEEIALILEELPPTEAARILRSLSAHEAGELLVGMDPDDAAHVVEQLPDEEVHKILVRMQPADAAEIRSLSGYAPDTAGGISTPAHVARAPGDTA